MCDLYLDLCEKHKIYFDPADGCPKCEEESQKVWPGFKTTARVFFFGGASEEPIQVEVG
jgi:hypothetical protein